ncbi:MAG: hypothetical protein IH901_02575 [Proteobacteria bacterium]|nr:hypothetical protein [Pseudomonadota bacterium]
MSVLETLMVQVIADVDPLKEDLKEVEKLIEETGGKLDKTLKNFPALNEFVKDGALTIGKDYQKNLISKALDPTAKLSDFDKQFLNDIENISKILKEDLMDASKVLQEALKAKNVDPEIIEILVKNFEETGEKRIDDLIEDFTDEIEEAVEALSKAVSEAFVEMAMKGEFSAKKIGDAFLKTFLDIVSKELIQKPLEQLLGSLFSALFGTKLPSGGSAAGGAVAAGVPTFINEQGQEIFIPHTPGRILNAPDSQRLLGGGSQVIINQNLKFDTAIKNDMMATIFQASPLLVEYTKQAVLQTLQGRRIN